MIPLPKKYKAYPKFRVDRKTSPPSGPPQQFVNFDSSWADDLLYMQGYYEIKENLGSTHRTSPKSQASAFRDKPSLQLARRFPGAMNRIKNSADTHMILTHGLIRGCGYQNSFQVIIVTRTISRCGACYTVHNGIDVTTCI